MISLFLFRLILRAKEWKNLFEANTIFKRFYGFSDLVQDGSKLFDVVQDGSTLWLSSERKL
jgi:hypothetical protein